MRAFGIYLLILEGQGLPKLAKIINLFVNPLALWRAVGAALDNCDIRSHISATQVINIK